jgi:hypothetical protein
MALAAVLWDSVFHRISIFSLLVLVLSYTVLAQSTTTVTATSKTITGTTTVTNAPSLLTNCDGVGTCKHATTFPPSPIADGYITVFCPTGTCYTGHDGFIGCCTVWACPWEYERRKLTLSYRSSCAARTTCIAYTENVVQTCNVDFGGCVSWLVIPSNFIYYSYHYQTIVSLTAR